MAMCSTIYFSNLFVFLLIWLLLVEIDEILCTFEADFSYHESGKSELGTGTICLLIHETFQSFLSVVESSGLEWSAGKHSGLNFDFNLSCSLSSSTVPESSVMTVVEFHSVESEIQ